MAGETKITLTEDEEGYVRSLVEHGRYPSISAALQRGLSKLREELEPIDRMLRERIQPRAEEPFVLLTPPSATAYGVERAAAVTKDISGIGAYAFSNSMSWVAADDEAAHERAGTSRIEEVEAAIKKFTGGQSEVVGLDHSKPAPCGL